MLNCWEATIKLRNLSGEIDSESEDSEMLLTPDQVDVYRDNHLARSSILHLTSFQNRNSSVILKPKEHCSMRDYLFVELALTNACRPGSIVNMLMSDMKKLYSRKMVGQKA